MTTLHATCVSIAGRGVLLTGPSGAGKSDLAFRLIDRGAMLVADDGVTIAVRDGGAHAACPATIAGRIELRGVGILTVPYCLAAPVALCVALDRAPERMPPDPLPARDIVGIAVPLIGVDPREPSAPVKVEQALMLYGLQA